MASVIGQILMASQTVSLKLSIFERLVSFKIKNGFSSYTSAIDFLLEKEESK
jgi:hypothetical protein